MPIFREQTCISPYEHTKSISIRTCICKVVQQLFIKYLITNLNTFSICKYVGLASHPFGTARILRPLKSSRGPPSLVLISLCRESSALSAKRATTHLVATEADGRSVLSSGPSRMASIVVLSLGNVCTM